VGEVSITGTVGCKDVDTSDDADPWQFPVSALGEITIADAGDLTLRVAAERIDPDAEMGLTLAEIRLTRVG